MDVKVRRGSLIGHFLRWWYALTSLSEVEQSSAVQRELIHKSRLLSVIVLFLLVIFVMFIPACLFLPNHFVLVADLSMLCICGVTLALNRTRHVVFAGVLLTVSFEAAITMVIFTTLPLDAPSIQQYELLVFGELLAVSLFRPRRVFLVAFLNSLIIVISLIFQPHTAMLNQDLQMQFWPMLVRPIGVQMLVAGVTYLWVTNALSYIARANQAEAQAMLAQQAAEKEQQQLQEHIKTIARKHAESMNSRQTIKLSLHEFEPVLWPLINSYNSLQYRLHHAHITETQLLHLSRAIQECTEKIHRGESVHHLTWTRTRLDGLLIAMREQQRRTSSSQNSSPPISQWSLPHS